jgi:hypothetical protein
LIKDDKKMGKSKSEFRHDGTFKIVVSKIEILKRKSEKKPQKSNERTTKITSIMTNENSFTDDQNSQSESLL